MELGKSRPALPSTDLDIMCNGFISPLQLPTGMGAPGRVGILQSPQHSVSFINTYGVCWCMDMYIEGREGIIHGMSVQMDEQFDG